MRRPGRRGWGRCDDQPSKIVGTVYLPLSTTNHRDQAKATGRRRAKNALVTGTIARQPRTTKSLDLDSQGKSRRSALPGAGQTARGDEAAAGSRSEHADVVAPYPLRTHETRSAKDQFLFPLVSVLPQGQAIRPSGGGTE
jgi:hypothetical protein